MRDAAPGRATAALVAAAAFFVYALGACRTIYVGDSGELVTAVYTLGIPHPSGYPLYVMLGKLWTLLVPLGSIAYRMSLFSAACGAAACGVLTLVAFETGAGAAASVLGGFLLAFAPSFWAEANVQRVYTLNALFVALATLFAVRWWNRRTTRLLALAFFFCGLGATNHTFMGVYAAALALFAALTDRRARSPRVALACLAALVIGLLPYAYLPIRSSMHPVLDWGSPRTLRAFVDVVTRRGFWGRRFYEGAADFLPIGADFFRGFGEELAWGGALLAFAGLWVFRPRRGPALLAPLVILTNLVAMALHGSRSDIFIWHRYDIPAYVMGAWLAALGAHALFVRAPRWAVPAAFLLPAALLAGGWREHDRHLYRIGEEYSRGVLADVPPGAHLAASDDNILFVLMYLHHVDGLRPDVDLILQGVGGEIPSLHFDPDRDPLFFTDHPNWRVPGLQTVASGLAFRIVRAGPPPPMPPIRSLWLPGEKDPRVPKDYLTQNLIGHFHYMLGVTLERRSWAEARRQYDLAMAASPRNDVLFYNLGIIYRGNGFEAESLAYFRRAQEIDPRMTPISRRHGTS
ncbi:MAG TPA: DUF2723 domain-containing protein [Thermoanaerobaculia bacterium]|nr:DUF2723 domain-containing protein [Thermoanaerobaculia bacterium]